MLSPSIDKHQVLDYKNSVLLPKTNYIAGSNKLYSELIVLDEFTVCEQKLPKGSFCFVCLPE